MASPPNSHPTVSQIKQVMEILKEPLTEKQVMIPLTTKAFFAGSLQPTTTSRGGEEEQVLVRLGKDHLVEMDRTEAQTYLDKRIESLQEGKSITTAEPLQTTSRSIPPASRTNDDESSALPYFEIREEYDETGREVRAEAINVMKELEYLEKKESSEKDTAPSDDGVSKTASASKTAEETTEPPTDRLAPISDEDYCILSNRLDELARLEEEAEKTRKVNKKSAKKLQSKGWAKGFLEKKAGAPPMAKTIPKESVPAQNPISHADRKVAFKEENEVREIPRVGEIPAAELLKPAPSSRKTIESDVFSGVIRERPLDEEAQAPPSTTKPTRPKMSRFAQERQQRAQRTEEQR